MTKVSDMTIDEVLNYSVPYEGEYAFSLSDFDKLCFDKEILNSRINKILEDNLGDYRHFMDGYIFLKSKIVNCKRVISFDTSYFIQTLLSSLGRELERKEYDKEELIRDSKQYIMEVKGKLESMNGLNDLKDIIPVLYKYIINNKYSYNKLQDKIVQLAFFHKFCDMLPKVSDNLEKVIEELERPIEEKYFEGVDKEKFMLFNLAMSMNLCNNTVGVHNSIYTVMKYLKENERDNVKRIKLKEKIGYALYGSKTTGTINFCDYSYLNKLYREYMSKHQSIKEEVIPEEVYYGKDIEEINLILSNRRSDYINERKQQMERLKERQKTKQALQASVLQMSWEFLPKKQEYNRNNISTSIHAHNEASKCKNPRFQEVLEEQLEFFEGPKYEENILVHFYGKSKFEGYEAYLYDNGVVLLEKLNCNKSSHENTALYVMNLNNFVEFSKMSKPEIIEIIKANKNNGSDEVEIDRIMHSEGWQLKASEYIEKDTGIDSTMLREEVEKQFKKRIQC